MKEKVFTLIMAVVLSTCQVKAQTNTNTTVGQDLSSALSKLLTSSNMLWESHATYADSLTKKWGAGVGGYYIMTDTGGQVISLNSYSGVRIDWVDNGFWMPEGNVGLQTPIKVASWLQVTPFTYAGIGVPISGAQVAGLQIGGNAPRNNNGQATAILGAGVAVKLFSFSSGKYEAGVLGDVEKWSGFAGRQKRFGAWFKRNF